MNETTEPPDPVDSARENLQMIRDLMERSTVYRAVAALPALVGGVLAMIVCAVHFLFQDHIGKTAFVLSWLGVLLVVGVLNTWLFHRDCKAKGGEFPSPQMKHGLMAMGPPMIVMGCLGLVLVWVHGEFVRGVLMWVFGYGLGLLATSSFAPTSIKRLGWQFLVFGFIFLFLHEFGVGSFGENTVKVSSVFMFMSFSILNLSYAVRTWRDS